MCPSSEPVAPSTTATGLTRRSYLMLPGLKRRIIQVGYILLGIAIYTNDSLSAAVFYTLHHILVKTGLFMVAGLILMRYKTESLYSLDGIVRSSPGLAVLFSIFALSLAGIPPFSGFWAKLLLIEAAMGDGKVFAVIASIGVGALTVLSMLKIWTQGFCGELPKDVPPLPPKYAVPVAATIILALFSLTFAASLPVTHSIAAKAMRMIMGG